MAFDFSVGINAVHKGNGHAWSLEGVEMAVDDQYFFTHAEIGEGETAHEMMTCIFDEAFPHLARVIRTSEGEYDSEQVRAAALKDLETHQPSGILPKSLRDLDKGD